MISIIIPSYNSEKYIKSCLTSLLNQTYDDFEIIVVDDESLDNSVNLIKEMAKRDSRIKIYKIKHAGPGMARNLGIQKSVGEYLFFCDADDIVPSKSIEILFNKINTDCVDIVIGNYKIDYGDGTYEVFRTPSIEQSRFNSFFESVTVWNRIYRSSFIKENKIYFPKMYQGEDRIFLTNLYLKKPKISVLNKIIYIWQRHVKDENKTLSQKEDLNCLISQISCMTEFKLLMRNNKSKALTDHIKYNCGYLLDICQKIQNKEESNTAFKILNEYIEGLEWEEEDMIFKKVFYNSLDRFNLDRKINDT